MGISNEFSGLDMSALIGGPLKAICESQTMLAGETVKFIKEVGMEHTEDGSYGKVVNASFNYMAPVEGADDGGVINYQNMEMSIPLLSIVKIPTFGVDEANITFDMEVKSSTTEEKSSDKSGELEGSAGLRVGPFHMDVKIKGSVACHEKNTRTTDNSAKYHVDVHAKDFGMPEGLARVLDILSTSMAPRPIGEPKADPTKEDAA
jgi:hypothetical protein